MCRSTRVRAGENKMMGVHRTWLLHVEKKCSRSRRWKNDWSTWNTVDRLEEALGSEQETIACQSTYDLIHACREALRSEQEIIK